MSVDARARARAGIKDDSKPKLPKPELPELERIGNGWVAKFAGGVVIKVAHLKERSDEFSGEFTITCPGVDVIGGRLEWGSFNLLSARTRSGIASRLNEHVEGRWSEILDAFCFEVVQRERKGEPVQRTDPKAPRRPLSYVLAPLLPEGMATLIYGEGGTGKSTFAAAVALSVQTGRSVFPKWAVALTAPVLVLDWEASLEVWEDRLNAVARGAGLVPEPVAYRFCRRKLVDDAEAIADMIIDNNVGLVIVDAINGAFGVGREHEDPAESAIRAFGTIREISGRGVTWMLLDHVTGETMKEGQNGHTPLKSYGSVSKQWLARQMFYLAGSREATETRQELVLKHTKANYSWRMPPLPIVIRRDGESIKFEFSESIESTELAGQLTLAQRITAALKIGPMQPPEIRNELGLSAKKSDVDKVLVVLGRMVRRGELMKLSDGRYQLDPGNQQAELEAPPPSDPDEVFS